MKTGIYWQDPKYALKPGRDFIFDPSLVLYLPLYQLDGVSFMSKDKHGHLSTVTGALWTPQGRSFDGADDYINAGNDASLDITDAITIEAWFTAGGQGQAGYGRLISKEGSVFFLNFTSANILTCVIKDSGGTSHSIGVEVTYNVWHHIILAYNGALQTVDLDGEQFGTPASWVGDINTDTSNIVIGNREANDRSWDGLIGEVRIYNRMLTPLEIQHNYLATKWRYQ